MAERKIVTIHQPESYPWMGFFNKMLMADHYIILDNVNFRKNYFQNRNQILTKQGASFLTIPVETKNNLKINEVRIANQINWKKKHLSSLIQNYSKSPFLKNYKPFFEELYSKDYELLIDFNMKIIYYLREVLEISTPISMASKLVTTGGSTQLLVELCQSLNATHYLAGRDGSNYLDCSLFDAVNIDVVYQDFNIPEYQHFNQDSFYPYMSVFDLLFNYEPSKAKQIIESGDLLNERI
jgi:hypothetical protein